jgi:aspartyl-tRNA(Asn)/glutamyl-tRNA(Gln) amidotransferase subunit A
MTVRDLGRLLRTRQLSCTELIEQTLDAIKARSDSHWFITVTEEQARAEAAERDRELAAGHDRGPFHGIPIALKDLFYTRGIRTTAGSLIFRDFVPEYDSIVVEQLREAGAISVGKTNLHELAYGITSRNPHYGAVLNPLDPNRLAGGSSGGSGAVVAAGILPMALGTDTGGSIRIPASYCGIAGLKPTYGRVSRHGVLPLAFSLDHVGPLASCVDDCVLTMNVIGGADFNLSPRMELAGVRVGVPKNFFFENVDEQVAAAVLNCVSVMEAHGAAISEIEVPNLHDANAAARIVLYAEAAAVYVRYGDFSLFGDDVWKLLEQGREVAGHEYVNAQRARTVFRRDFDALWHTIDVFVTPTAPITAPGIDDKTVQIGAQEEDTRIATTRLVRSINFLGEPALSIPCGKSSSGMPIGLQLIAAPFTEPKLLQIGQTIETLLSA